MIKSRWITDACFDDAWSRRGLPAVGQAGVGGDSRSWIPQFLSQLTNGRLQWAYASTLTAAFSVQRSSEVVPVPSPAQQIHLGDRSEWESLSFRRCASNVKRECIEYSLPSPC